MREVPAPLERDSRGILDPWLLRQRVALTRYPATPALSGLVDRFWVVRWDLPAEMQHRQQVLTHPGANLSVGPPDARARTIGIEARLGGVARSLTTRVLAGRGVTVAALTRPGGLGAFLIGSAAEYTDRSVPLGAAIGLDETTLLARIGDGGEDTAQAVAVLARALEGAVKRDRVSEARRVAEIAALAETDRSLCRLDDLSTRTGTKPRTLQRMFHRSAGVSPTWVLRRYRLLDAAESVRSGQVVSWARIATELGYADQAHLTRDFRNAIGATPAAYAASLTSPGDHAPASH